MNTLPFELLCEIMKHLSDIKKHKIYKSSISMMTMDKLLPFQIMTNALFKKVGGLYKQKCNTIMTPDCKSLKISGQSVIDQSLKKLEYLWCFIFNDNVSLPKLKALVINHAPKRLPSTVEKLMINYVNVYHDFSYLTKLKTLRIYTYQTSEQCHYPPSLQKLKIQFVRGAFSKIPENLITLIIENNGLYPLFFAHYPDTLKTLMVPLIHTGSSASKKNFTTCCVKTLRIFNDNTMIKYPQNLERFIGSYPHFAMPSNLKSLTITSELFQERVNFICDNNPELISLYIECSFDCTLNKLPKTLIHLKVIQLISVTCINIILPQSLKSLHIINDNLNVVTNNCQLTHLHLSGNMEPNLDLINMKSLKKIIYYGHYHSGITFSENIEYLQYKFYDSNHFMITKIKYPKLKKLSIDSHSQDFSMMTFPKCLRHIRISFDNYNLIPKWIRYVSLT